MISVVKAILAGLNSIVEFISGFVSGLVNFVGMLGQIIATLPVYVVILPAGLAVFAILFIAIMVINRLSFGSNGD